MLSACPTREGSLELPASEDRRAALAVRAGWPLISSNLSDKPKVAVAVRESVKQIEGTTDEVITHMVLRHVRSLYYCSRIFTLFCIPHIRRCLCLRSLTLCAFSLARLFKSYAAQLDRADASADLRLHELAHLLAILMGIEPAVKLCRGVLGALEQGLEESWYEKKMRRMYGAG